MIDMKVAYRASHHKELLDSFTTGQQRIPVHPSRSHWAVVSAEFCVLTEFEFCTVIQPLGISEELAFPILLLGSQIFKCYLSKIEQHSQHYVTPIYKHANDSREDESLFLAELNSTLHPQLHLK